MKQLSIYEDVYLAGLDKQCSPEPIHFSAKAQEANTSYSGPSSVSSDTSKVTEIVLTQNKADSIQLILPMLINLHQEMRWLAWIDPPIQLLKEWQKTHKEKALNEIMLLRSNDSFSVFELSKRALEAGTCHAVIAWTNTLSPDQFSSLEEASATGNSHGIILRSRV